MRALPRLPLAALAAAAACGGTNPRSGSNALAYYESYDPRSLDPALSTDVPTGRAVGYLFEGLTRFTPDAKVEPSLANVKALDRYQFERLGYFCVDRESAPGKPVFNRTVALKDTWAKIEKGRGGK